MTKEIPVLYHPDTDLHQPVYEIFNGEKKTHHDIPKRTKIILDSLKNSGITDIQISTLNNLLSMVSRVHDSNYLLYLQQTSQYALKVSKEKQLKDFAIYPSIHPYSSYAQSNNFISRRGYYIFDTYTPIMKSTYVAALSSAGVAVAGAELLISGEPLVYCACRPSGHHAMGAMGGGMCYINNVAVAATHLHMSNMNKIAILDLDFHHGNGTQDIFYKDQNTFVVNIHGDPKYTYPHFTGYSEEIGFGDGENTNKNFPLPPNTSNERYHHSATKAISLIKNYKPDYLLISAGFDTHEDDPMGTFKLTTEYYHRLGESIKQLDLPLLVIQEGGYATDSLGENVVSFLKGLKRN